MIRSMMKNNKLNTIQFAQALFGLEPDTQIAHEFDMEFGQTDDRWWSCQREHFAMWAITQNTNGVKGYKHKPNTSAMIMYNRIGAPELLLWLIEALHISLKQEDEEPRFKKFMEEFRELVVELSKLGRDFRQKQCKMIRDKYSYDMIEELLIKHREKVE